MLRRANRARAANCCSWFERGLPLSSFGFYSWSSVSFILFVLFFLSSRCHERSCVARVDDEPALLVSYRLTHPPRGWGIIWRTQDGDGRQGRKIPDRLVRRTWPCYTYSYHNLLRLPGGCFRSSVRLLFPSVLSLALLCVACSIHTLRTAVPFWGQTTQISSINSVSPKRAAVRNASTLLFL